MMSSINLEYSKLQYKADFVFYAMLVLAVILYLVVFAVNNDWTGNALLLLSLAVGLFSWSLIEYLIHRFVLHGVQPFKRWHLEHHARPTALIGAPTLLSSGLIFSLVFLPAWVLMSLQSAAALTLGILAGYLAYGAVHHGVHHWRVTSAWLKKRKLWHALHHHPSNAKTPGRYGVSTSFWDHVFGTLNPRFASDEHKD
jgi:sterol desaturase/sphingolipid hydroxylase (fatty acid hydroxylase superfamily)